MKYFFACKQVLGKGRFWAGYQDVGSPSVYSERWHIPGSLCVDGFASATASVDVIATLKAIVTAIFVVTAISIESLYCRHPIISWEAKRPSRVTAPAPKAPVQIGESGERRREKTEMMSASMAKGPRPGNKEPALGTWYFLLPLCSRGKHKAEKR